jgi:indolepyruvate ferredoxin oxidoreductase beta subunit
MSDLKIYIAGVGGQGSLTFSRLLGEAALAANLGVVVSEVHGMSQRGGVVESSVLIGDGQSPLIGAGDADVVVAFEPAEALRSADKISAKTAVLVNTRRTIPFTVTLGAATYPDVEPELETLRGVARSVLVFDASALAEQAGSAMAVNMVMMGALARVLREIAPNGAPVLDDATLLSTVQSKTPPKFHASNERAFALGKEAVAAVN